MKAQKNIAENLAIRKNCVTLYCQRAISHIADIYKLRDKACPCYTSASCGCSSLARKGGAPFFSHILTYLFLAKCQRAKQVVRPRSIVRVPHPHVFTRVPLRPIGRIIHPTKSNTRTSCKRRHPRMLSGGSSCCLRLCTPPTPPSWVTSSVSKLIESWHILSLS